MRRSTVISTFGVTGITLMLSMVTSIVLARVLGPEERGVLLAIVFWPQFLLSILNFSLNEATIYRVAKARSGDKVCIRDDPSGAALMLHLALAGGVTLISLQLLPLVFGTERTQQLPMVLSFAAVFTPLVILNLYYNAIHQGRGKPHIYNMLRLCQPVVYTLALIVLVLLQMIRIETVLVAMLVSTGTSVLMGLFLDRTRSLKWDRASMIELLRTAGRFHVANLILYVAMEADKIIVIRWMDDASVGIYAVALAVSTLGSGIIVRSFVILAYPKISAIADQKTQIALICQFARSAMLLLVLVNGAAAVLSPWLLPLVFGQDFEPAVPISIILLFMNTFRGIRQVIDRVLRATLQVRLSMISESLGLVSFVILAPVGSQLGGLAGIAWAMAAAQCVAFVAITIGVIRRYDLHALDLWGLRVSTVILLLCAAHRELLAVRGRRSR